MPIFMTLANVVTALLDEFQKEYVMADTPKDKKMRRKIRITEELINSSKEISNVMIKGNPFKKHSHGSVSGNKNVLDSSGSQVANLGDESVSSGSEDESIPSSRDANDFSEVSGLEALLDDLESGLRPTKERITFQARRHQSMLVTNALEQTKWLQDYSNYNLQETANNLITRVTRGASMQSSGDHLSLPSPSILTINRDLSYIARGEGSTKADAKLVKYADTLAQVDSFDFDCLEVNRSLRRKNTFTMVVYKIMQDLQ